MSNERVWAHHHLSFEQRDGNALNIYDISRKGPFDQFTSAVKPLQCKLNRHFSRPFWILLGLQQAN